MSKDHHAALRVAVETAGGQAQLAEICGCTRQAIHQAMKAERGLPAAYCLKVEQVLGITRYALRPDIFGPHPRAKR